MKPEQIERNQKFCADLRANNGKEARAEMYAENGNRCCLAVALDTALANGYIPPTFHRSRAEGVPPESIAEFYGWVRRDPPLSYGDETLSALCLNDGKLLSHAEMADVFEATFPEIKAPLPS